MKRKSVRRPSLCWKCKNAVPTKNAGCNWSRDAELVSGWFAEKSAMMRRDGKGGMVYTYNVIACPEFKEETGAEEYSCENENGCLALAEKILKSECDSYRDALARYKKEKTAANAAKLRNIERDLLSPYYSTLCCGTIDFLEFCNSARRKCGLPPIDDFLVKTYCKNT